MSKARGQQWAGRAVALSGDSSLLPELHLLKGVPTITAVSLWCTSVAFLSSVPETVDFVSDIDICEGISSVLVYN